MTPLVKKFYKTQAEYNKQLLEFKKETSRIVNIITAFCKKPGIWWTFDFTTELTDKPPQEIKDNFMIIYISQPCTVGDSHYHEGFPAQFYNMTDKEILNYLKSELKRFESRNNKKIV